MSNLVYILCSLKPISWNSKAEFQLHRSGRPGKEDSMISLEKKASASQVGERGCPRAGPGRRSCLGSTFLVSILCAQRRSSGFLLTNIPRQSHRQPVSRLTLAVGLALGWGAGDRAPSAIPLPLRTTEAIRGTSSRP